MPLNISGSIVNSAIAKTLNYSSIVTRGLILHLDAGAPDSYPTTGTAWSSLIGTGVGTLTNGPTYSSTNGGAIIFDGVDDWLNLPTSGFGLPTFSVDFWVKFNATGNGSFWWNLADSTGGNPELRLSITGANQIGYTWYDAGAYIFQTQSTATLSINTWYHFVSTTTNGQYIFYINGAVDKSLGGSTYDGGTLACHSIATYNLYGTSPGYGGYTNMSLGSYKFYNRILNATEISQNYNAQKSRFGY